MMKGKKITILVSFLVLAVILTGISIADENDEIPGAYYGDDGPAPNSGDGDPDGSGYDHLDPIGPADGMGPAPNSGDGVPDGSGF